MGKEGLNYSGVVIDEMSQIQKTMSVELTVRFGMKEPVRVAVPVDMELWGIAPLPRNREILWEIDAQREAANMRMKRDTICKLISRQLAHQILEIIESRDPHNGYYPDSNE